MVWDRLPLGFRVSRHGVLHVEALLTVVAIGRLGGMPPPLPFAIPPGAAGRKLSQAQLKPNLSLLCFTFATTAPC